MIKIDWKMICSLRKNKENASFSSSLSSYIASVIKQEEDVKITYYGVEEEVKEEEEENKEEEEEVVWKKSKNTFAFLRPMAEFDFPFFS